MTPLTPQAAHAFAESWFGAWNAHDLDAIMAHYAPAIEHTSPRIARYSGAEGSTLRGIAAVRDYFRSALERWPTVRFERLHVAVGLGSVVLIYRHTNEDLAAETLFFDESGKIVRSVSHYEIT